MIRLWISPHLDDAALSCGGHILRAVARGQEVVVATVFSAGGEDQDVRRDEDLAAWASVGATAVHLGFPDAPFRAGIPRSYRGLVLDAAVDASLAAEIGAAIATLVRELAPAEVALPLGVGGHVDHRTTFAARAFLPAPLVFYEDRPYAFAEAFVRLRLHEIGAAPADPGTLSAPLRAAFSELPHLRAYGPPPGELEAVIDAHLGPVACFAPGLALRAERAVFDGATLARVAALVAHYRSQCPDLFGAASAEELARTYAARGGGALTERIHRPS